MCEMIERVVEALKRLPIRDATNLGSQLDQLRLREAARAVYEAIREPTPEALYAMSDGFGKEPSRDDSMPHYLQRQKNAMAAMVDEILNA